MKAWLAVDALLLLTAGCAMHVRPTPPTRPHYEMLGRVWQRQELRDARGVRYELKVVVLGPRSDEHRMFVFTDEHTFYHFQVDDCAVVVVRGGEVKLRACEIHSTRARIECPKPTCR